MPTPFDELLARLWILVGQPGVKSTQDTADAKAVLDQLAQIAKNTTNRLERSERRLRTLVESIPIGLLVTSQTGTIEVTNKGGLALLGCKIEDVVNRSLADIFTTDGGATLAPEDGSSKPKEATAKKPSGGTFQTEMVIRSFDDESGGHWLVLFQDISARLELEQTKEEFLSMLTHDLRTPLTSIQAYVAMIQDGHYDRDLDGMKSRAGGVSEDAARLIDIITTLLDVYKLEEGRLDMFFDIVPAATITKRSIQSVLSSAQQRKISIDCASVDRALHVNADEHYVVQVIVNLLSNAIRFSESGETVTIKVDAEENLIKFSVIDTGPGISDELKPRLFNRFEQAKIFDDRVKGGTGLGLAFARAIVEQHGGTIGVESPSLSVQNCGSTFWFTLPRVQI